MPMTFDNKARNVDPKALLISLCKITVPLKYIRNNFNLCDWIRFNFLKGQILSKKNLIFNQLKTGSTYLFIM